MKMKPHIKFDKNMNRWLCGGLAVSPWYIDWFSGNSPQEAYGFWKKSI
jgi:hypothetical protein